MAGDAQTAAMRSHLRVWRWLLALLIGIALLQPLLAVHAADRAADHAAHCGAVVVDASDAADATDAQGSVTAACGVCAALPALERRPVFAPCGADAPAQRPHAVRDRVQPPETPPPIG